MQACGAWIRGSVGLDGWSSARQYLAFADGAERAAAVRHAEAELYDGARLATTNLGKFGPRASARCSAARRRCARRASSRTRTW